MTKKNCERRDDTDTESCMSDPERSGPLSEAAADPEISGEDRPINICDLGYRGIRKEAPGAGTWIGIKRNAGSDPDTGRLTQRDPAHNAGVARARITIRHAIGRIKQCRITTTRPCRGTPDQFNDELNAVTGMVNLKAWSGRDPQVRGARPDGRTGLPEDPPTPGRPGAALPEHEKRAAPPGAGRLRTSPRDHAAPAPARLTPPRGLPSRGG